LVNTAQKNIKSKQNTISDQENLNKNVQAPLYAQLADSIRSDITEGKLKKGDMLPTEKELGELYGVSRITVRGALSVLVEEGLIYRKKGRGTIVKQDKLTRQAPGLLGIHEEIRGGGSKPKTELIAFEIEDNPPAEIKHHLGLHDKEKAVKIERAIYADNEILGTTIAHIPLRIWEKIGISFKRLGNQSLYRLLGRHGFILYEAEETIEVIRADKRTAKQLDVSRGFPLFYLKRTVYTKEGIPIECGLNIFRADKYKFKLHHWRPVELQKD
jgi:GntR family transcriptional regulator, N-acetylglucosamine utilization regulator